MRINEKKKLHENLKQEIRSLLISSPKTKYGGLSGSLLYSDYKKLNSGKEVPYVELGFHSFLALLRSMPDVVRIECKENSPSYRVHPVYDQTTAHIQKMVFEQRDKYQHENQLYNQNWHSNKDTKSNKQIPFNFYKNGQLPYLYNSLSYYTFNNVSNNFHHNTKNFFRQSFPQKFFISNEQRRKFSFQPYLLVTSSNNNEKENGKINYQSIDKLSYVPLTSIDNHKNCSSSNIFQETPPHFDLNDYHLDESIEISENDIDQENNYNSSIDHRINTSDDPLLTTSINDPQNSEIDQPLTSSLISIQNSSIISSINNKNISEDQSNNSEYPIQSTLSIIEEEKPLLNKELFFEISHCDEQEQSKIDENRKFLKRINDALRQCIDFRYIHRLHKLKFEYRHYPLSIETSLIKSKLEKLAFNKYQHELDEFEKISQLNTSIDDHLCQTMFNEYIYLQRNYHYMTKLMRKNKQQ
ncbi:unnamed protein product [Rotaria sordida]|uniref:HTH OST-type domain-containing protein n=1 Tax=Rotaria sordida TaxID=392033 RepID=A0A813QAM7_9BILA|nr:unnamed protein product [Rotaria sordida]